MLRKDLVVHDEETLQEAIDLVKREPVRYSDLNLWVIIESPERLETLARIALQRDDVVVVAPVWQSYVMEAHATARKRIREQRRVHRKSGDNTQEESWSATG